MNYYVYIIQSTKDNKFYTGITNDITRRLKEHCIGKQSTPSTLHRGPFVLIYQEKCSTRKSARIREKFWKSGLGRDLRDKMVEELVTVAQPG